MKKNFTIFICSEKAHILDACLAPKKGKHLLKLLYKFVSKSFDSENKLFIEFTPLGFQTGVFQRLGLFLCSQKCQIIEGTKQVKSH